MSALRTAAIRLAASSPGPVRDALLPILKKAAAAPLRISNPELRKLLEPGVRIGGWLAFVPKYHSHGFRTGVVDGETVVGTPYSGRYTGSTLEGAVLAALKGMWHKTQIADLQVGPLKDKELMKPTFGAEFSAEIGRGTARSVGIPMPDDPRTPLEGWVQADYTILEETKFFVYQLPDGTCVCFDSSKSNHPKWALGSDPKSARQALAKKKPFMKRVSDGDWTWVPVPGAARRAAGSAG